MIHYQIAGTGPMILISQSGEGDADRTADLLRHLTGDFTVITYDRRGLSRSRIDHGVSVAEHADDVHELLAHLTDEPVHMLGCSLGALIGLHLKTTHPEQLRTLVAHEPIAPWLLPDPEVHRDELRELRAHYLDHGLTATLPLIVKTLGIDPGTGEPDRTDFPMDANRVANFDYFIRHDFAAVIADDLEPADLDGVVAAAGATTPHTVFDYQCAELLADRLGQELEVFPGGHNGNLSHPRAYAEKLKEILSRRPSSSPAYRARRSG